MSRLKAVDDLGTPPTWRPHSWKRVVSKAVQGVSGTRNLDPLLTKPNLRYFQGTRAAKSPARKPLASVHGQQRAMATNRHTEKQQERGLQTLVYQRLLLSAWLLLEDGQWIKAIVVEQCFLV